mmetsp:Transcript_15856/g.26150  ORF Transcript_15856/g.26150 Transcript_15856/m.26150 type:complete len:438 (-) Transcript_15856:485-1798(-)
MGQCASNEREVRQIQSLNNILENKSQDTEFNTMAKLGCSGLQSGQHPETKRPRIRTDVSLRHTRRADDGNRHQKLIHLDDTTLRRKRLRSVPVSKRHLWDPREQGGAVISEITLHHTNGATHKFRSHRNSSLGHWVDFNEMVEQWTIGIIIDSQSSDWEKVEVLVWDSDTVSTVKELLSRQGYNASNPLYIRYGNEMVELPRDMVLRNCPGMYKSKTTVASLDSTLSASTEESSLFPLGEEEATKPLDHQDLYPSDNDNNNNGDNDGRDSLLPASSRSSASNISFTLNSGGLFSLSTMSHVAPGTILNLRRQLRSPKTRQRFKRRREEEDPNTYCRHRDLSMALEPEVGAFPSSSLSQTTAISPFSPSLTQIDLPASAFATAEHDDDGNGDDHGGDGDSTRGDGFCHSINCITLMHDTLKASSSPSYSSSSSSPLLL